MRAGFNLPCTLPSRVLLCHLGPSFSQAPWQPRSNAMKSNFWIWQLVVRAPDWGITSMGCVCYRLGCLLSRLLRDAAESADAMDWEIAFLFLIVRVVNENLCLLVFYVRVSNLLVLVSLPQIGRLVNFKSGSTMRTATWLLSILYMKASLWIRCLVWKGSSLSCSNRDVILVVREYDDKTHLAAEHWLFF